jgi:hypothetical protein
VRRGPRSLNATVPPRVGALATGDNTEDGSLVESIGIGVLDGAGGRRQDRGARLGVPERSLGPIVRAHAVASMVPWGAR